MLFPLTSPLWDTPMPLPRPGSLAPAPSPRLPRLLALQYRVTVPLMGAVSDLCEALSRLSGVAAENVRRGVPSAGACTSRGVGFHLVALLGILTGRM